MFSLRTTRKVVEISFKKIEDIEVLPRKPRIKETNSGKKELWGSDETTFYEKSRKTFFIPNKKGRRNEL